MFKNDQLGMWSEGVKRIICIRSLPLPFHACDSMNQSTKSHLRERGH